MLRTTLPAALAFACLAVVESAHAQTAVSGLGNKGQFIVSADRLFGINVWSAKNEPQATPSDMNPGNPTKDSGTAITLLWGVQSGSGTLNAPVYSIPRLAFDFALIPSLTLGGALGYLHQSSSHEQTNNNGSTTTVDLPSTNAILINPRVGYIFDFTPLLSLWARGGFTYHWVKSEGTNQQGNTAFTTKVSSDGLALTIDPQLVITPVPHFGITVGPMFDIPLTGSTKGETTGTIGPVSTTVTSEANTKVTNWGISAGVLGYF
jgi:hypothetical protein